MSFIKKKNFLYKLIVCLCIFFAIINCTNLSKVYAKSEDSGIGGVLLNPISNLLGALGDAIMTIIQKSVMGTDPTAIVDNSDESWWEKLSSLGKGLIVLAAIVVVAILITIIPGGWAAVFGYVMAHLPGIIMGAVKIGAFICIVGSSTVQNLITSVAGAMADNFSDTIVLPQFTIGPEEIFSGRVLLFDANIFNPKQVYVEYKTEDGKTSYNTTLEDWNSDKIDKEQYHAARYYYYSDEDKDGDGKLDQIATSTNNSASQLKNEIAKWYYIIRNIALVGAIITLLYIGIRMTITSIAADKAKYKQMLYDWLIALCLMVCMHYIMIFAHNMAESIIKIFSADLGKHNYIFVINEPGDHFEKSMKELEKESGMKYLSDDGKSIIWPTNLMGQFRLKSQEVGSTKLDHFGYTLAYLTLVIFTLIFSVTYIKRLLYLLFLTVIAPLVALTYPLDKIHDGKAQAFDMWLREYIFNLLIQPFHLLLYTIFVTMAFELASTNVIYSLVVIGFMIPAEKFLRTMFGFNKASTPGLFNGAAGAALTMSAVHALGRFSKGGQGKNGSNVKNQEKNDKVSMRSSDPNYSQASLFTDAGAEMNDGSSENTNPQSSDNSLDNNSPDNNSPDNNSPDNNSLDTHSPGNNSLDDHGIDNSDFDSEGAESDTWTFEDWDAYASRELEKGRLEQDTIEDETEPVEGSEVRTPERTTISRPSKIKSLASTVGRRVGTGFNVAWKNVGKESFKEAGRKLPGEIIGGVVGAGVATLATGGAIVASTVKGDPGDLLKNTGVAVTAGTAIGKGVSNRISKDNSYIKELNEQGKRQALGEAEYKRRMQEKELKKFEKDGELRRLYKEKLKLKTKEQVDIAMKQAAEYKKHGVEDDKYIIKAMQLNNGNESNRDSKKRIAAAKIAEASKTPKDLEAYMKSFSKTPGITDKQVNDMEKLVRQINIDL